MTKVADEVIAKFARKQHDWMERVLKNSLDPEEVARAVQTIINRGEKIFDKAAYFKTRPGLYVDPDLERHVGFTTKPASGLKSLTSYTLERGTSEADIFGLPGSAKRNEVMASAVDLSQIDGLIDLQPGGVQGKLLNDGRANLFAVIGKSGELRVVPVYWHAVNCEWRVLCGPWRGRSVWRDGRQVFSNKL